MILTGTHLVTLLFFLPETQRKIVGNGSIPPRGVHRSLFWVLFKRRKFDSVETPLPAQSRGHHFPNPFTCIPVLFHKGSLSVILVGSFTYAVKMTLQTSLAAQCIRIYDLNYIEGGLIYLPSGVGGGIGSYTTGTSWSMKSPPRMEVSDDA